MGGLYLPVLHSRRLSDIRCWMYLPKISICIYHNWQSRIIESLYKCIYQISYMCIWVSEPIETLLPLIVNYFDKVIIIKGYSYKIQQIYLNTIIIKLVIHIHAHKHTSGFFSNLIKIHWISSLAYIISKMITRAWNFLSFNGTKFWLFSYGVTI